MTTKVIPIDKEIDVSKIHIEQDDEIIWCFLGNYKFFLNNGKSGFDAYLLYSHLQFTARLQHTNSIKANNAYLCRGLRWNVKRLKKAKSFLRSFGFISYKQLRVDGNRFGETFIVVKTARKPPKGPISGLPENGTSRNGDKCFNPTRNTLSINGVNSDELHTARIFKTVKSRNNFENALNDEPTLNDEEEKAWFRAEIEQCLQHYLGTYGTQHPSLRLVHWKRIVSNLRNCEYTEDSIFPLYEAFVLNVDTDGNLLHFATPGILQYRHEESR